MKALAIRRKLAAADPHDPKLQVELLGTMLNLARISEQFGDLDGALALQQQRLEIEQRLTASHDSEDLRYNIAASLIGIGEVNLWLGNYETALDYERRSLAMNQALLDANPASLKLLRGVWRSRGWTATVLRFDRKFAEGAAESRKALAISEQLAARDPNNSEYQRFLIVDDQNLCECLAYAGAASEVPGLCQKAISINEAMVRSDKSDVQASADLANSNMTMGLALYLIHLPREALDFERRADAMYREVAEHDPDSQSNAIDHAVALIYAGRIEAELHLPEQARTRHRTSRSDHAEIGGEQSKAPIFSRYPGRSTRGAQCAPGRHSPYRGPLNCSRGDACCRKLRGLIRHSGNQSASSPRTSKLPRAPRRWQACV